MKKFAAAKEKGEVMFDGVSPSDVESEAWLNDALAEAMAAEKSLSLKLYRLRFIHREVERKRSKQDTKSKVRSQPRSRPESI